MANTPSTQSDMRSITGARATPRQEVNPSLLGFTQAAKCQYLWGSLGCFSAVVGTNATLLAGYGSDRLERSSRGILKFAGHRVALLLSAVDQIQHHLSLWLGTRFWMFVHYKATKIEHRQNLMAKFRVVGRKAPLKLAGSVSRRRICDHIRCPPRTFLLLLRIGMTKAPREKYLWETIQRNAAYQSSKPLQKYQHSSICCFLISCHNAIWTWLTGCWRTLPSGLRPAIYCSYLHLNPHH